MLYYYCCLLVSFAVVVRTDGLKRLKNINMYGLAVLVCFCQLVGWIGFVTVTLGGILTEAINEKKENNSKQMFCSQLM